MSLLHIHPMKEVHALDIFHQVQLMTNICLLIGKHKLQLGKNFSLALFLHLDLCPFSGAEEGGIQGTESWREEMRTFSSSGVVYSVARES